jgi:hypothetical protein
MPLRAFGVRVALTQAPWGAAHGDRKLSKEDDYVSRHCWSGKRPGFFDWSICRRLGRLVQLQTIAEYDKLVSSHTELSSISPVS